MPSRQDQKTREAERAEHSEVDIRGTLRQSCMHQSRLIRIIAERIVLEFYQREDKNRFFKAERSIPKRANNIHSLEHGVAIHQNHLKERAMITSLKPKQILPTSHPILSSSTQTQLSTCIYNFPYCTPLLNHTTRPIHNPHLRMYL